MTLQLASTVWPRSGGDRGNRGLVSLEGPISGEVIWSIALRERKVSDPRGPSGLVVGQDSSLRVVHAGSLFGIQFGGGAYWERSLGSVEYHSLPVALADGRTLIATSEGMVLYDGVGKLDALIQCNFSLDDSGLSPCLTYGGTLVATSPFGGVYRLEKSRWVELGVFGYDILPPAVFEDDTLAITGYDGSGFCRVTLSGNKVWETGFLQADLLPCVASNQYSAVGSLNDKLSRFFAPDGALIGTYSQPAVFAEYLTGRWVALSEGRVALLEADGDVIWTQNVPVKRNWGVYQPIVDSSGCVFVPSRGGVVGFGADGKQSLRVELGHGPPSPLTILDDRRLAFLYENRLVVIG